MRLPVLVALAAMPLCANSVMLSAGNAYYTCAFSDTGTPGATVSFEKNRDCTVPGGAGTFSATTDGLTQQVYLTGGGGEMTWARGITDGFDVMLPGASEGFAQVTYTDHFRGTGLFGSVFTLHGNALDAQYSPLRLQSFESWDVTEAKTAVLPIVFGQSFRLPGITAIGSEYQSNNGFLFSEAVTVEPLAIDVTPAAVTDAPEPATWTVMAMGLVLLVGRRRQR